MEKPLVNKKYQMQKFDGKGGWTYIVIGEIPKSERSKGGFVRVKGLVDDVEITSYNLFPMKSGEHFFPIKAEIRKKIKKNAGDWIKVVLYRDNDPIHIPGELLECLRDEPKAHKKFLQLNDHQQKSYIQWVYESKKDTTRAERIASLINTLLTK
jgi:hypothetical protein